MVRARGRDNPQSATALAWGNGESSTRGFSRVTQVGLLRLLTAASAMGGRPLTSEEGWNVYDALLADSRVRVFPELPALDEAFRSSRVGLPSPKHAYLAAYVSANDAVFVTFDRAFERFGVDCRIL